MFSFAGTKRPWYESDSDGPDETQPERSRRSRKEILIIDDEESIAGKGTAEDPIRFREFITGNIISESQNGQTIILDDDEIEEFPSPTVRKSPELSRGGFSSDEEEHDSDEEDFVLRDTRSTSSPCISLTSSAEPENPVSDDEDETSSRTANRTGLSISLDDSVRASSVDTDDSSVAADDYAALAESGYTSDYDSDGESDGFPVLSHSQDTNDSDLPETPNSSQLEPKAQSFDDPEDDLDGTDVFGLVKVDKIDKSIGSAISVETSDRKLEKEIKEEKNILKKTLFYSEWAPKNMEDLKKKLSELRPTTMAPGNCWLFSGPTGVGQSVLKIEKTFRHEGIRYKYSIMTRFSNLLLASEHLFQLEVHHTRRCVLADGIASMEAGIPALVDPSGFYNKMVRVRASPIAT